MNSTLAINRIAFKSCNFLPILSSRHYHPLTLNNVYTKPRHSPSAIVTLSSRNFSFPQFYLSIAQSTPVQTFQNLLIDLHQWTGLPWWSIIVLTTLGIRSAFVFPLAVHQSQVFSRLMNIQAEIGNLVPELNKEVTMARHMYNWDEMHAKRVFKKQLRKIHKEFVIRDNCHPAKTVLLAIFQIPCWITFSFSLRNITMMTYLTPEVAEVSKLKTEGALWFSDLTSPDPFILPVLLLVVNLALTEMHTLRRVGQGGPLERFMLYTSRAIILVVAAAATVNPSSVTFYWLCSSAIGLGQNLLLMNPKVKRFLRIPPTSTESATPFKDMADNFKKRFNLLQSSGKS